MLRSTQENSQKPLAFNRRPGWPGNPHSRRGNRRSCHRP
jgi:hypothetical protein